MRKSLTSLALLGLVSWVVGCSDQPTEPEAGTGGTNLTSEFGGYTAAAEAPAFGDDQLLVGMQDEVAFSDPMLIEPATSEMVADQAAGRFHLRVIWGRLRFDSTVSERTDWTGSLTISRGAEIVRRVIRFEPDQDFILPRTDRRLIEWVSATSVHNDGIAVDIFIPPARPTFDSVMTVDSLGNDFIVIDTIMPDPVVITFKTGPYSREFSLGELASLDTVVELGDGNSVAMHGIQHHPERCLRGFLHGQWGFDEEGRGVFRGMWANEHGDVVGFLKGHFGQTDDGRRMFFGKWITQNGKFEGFIRGRFEPNPDENAVDIADHRAGGWLRGEIFSAERNKIGELRGRYIESDRVNGGFFEGRWRLGCNHAMDPRGEMPGSGVFPDGIEM